MLGTSNGQSCINPCISASSPAHPDPPCAEPTRMHRSDPRTSAIAMDATRGAGGPRVKCSRAVVGHRAVCWWVVSCALPLLAAACAGGASAETRAALRRGELPLALRLYDAEGGRDPEALRAIAFDVLERE